MDMQTKKIELKKKLKDEVDKRIVDQICEKFEDDFNQLCLDSKENVKKYFQDLEKNKIAYTLLDIGRMIGGALGIVAGATASATLIGAVGGVPLIKHSWKYLLSGVHGANRKDPVKGDLFSLPSEDLALKNYQSAEILISICCGTISYSLTTESDKKN